MMSLSTHRQPAAARASVPTRAIRTAVSLVALLALGTVGVPLETSAQTSAWSSKTEGAGSPAARSGTPGTVLLPRAAAKPRMMETPVHQQTLKPHMPILQQSDAKRGTALRKGNEKAPAPPAAVQVPAGPDPAYAAFDNALFVTALKLAEKAAEKGEAEAHTLVGRIHAEGHGVPPNPGLAARWYQRAAELGDPEGAFALAVMYADGRGMPKDIAKAAAYFEQAALKGHIWANYNLGMMFLSGHGKPENPTRGALHIAYAAEKGIPAAQYDMATLHLSGVGVPADAYLASRWLKRAAQLGMPEAQFDYAVMLLRGQGLNEDRHDAFTYLRSAAERGLAGAQNRLAYALLEGVGIEKNPREAAKWRTLAREGGLPDDKLDALIRRLPAVDRTAGEELAGLWAERAVLGGGLQ